MFKSRALKRHETFNGMTKSYGILRERFRHGTEKVGRAFEAVCVICQYKIESEEPLYDVLIEDILNDTTTDDSDTDTETIDDESEELFDEDDDCLDDEES